MGGALEGGHVAQMLPDWTWESPEEKIPDPFLELLIENLEGRILSCLEEAEEVKVQPG